MKRQDVSGQNTLHTDASGGSATDVNIASVGGTPVTSPLPVSATGAVSVTQTTSPWITKQQRASTPVLTNVAASASSVTVLAANANRLMATIDNDSTVNLYAKFGATASTSSFTVKIPAGAYYELPGNYTGIVDGIWDSATGNARVTELTA